MVQWGKATTTGTGTVGAYTNITFPTSFSTTRFSTIGSHLGDYPVTVSEYIHDHYQTGGATLIASKRDGTALTGWVIYWTATGY